MAEDIAQLVVSLNLKAESFEQGMRRVERQLKTADAEFQANIAASGKMADSFGALNTKTAALQKRLDEQQSALQKYTDRTSELDSAIREAAKTHGELGPKVAEAKKAYEESNAALSRYTKELGENNSVTIEAKKQTEDLKRKYETLQGEYDRNERGIKKNQTSLERAELGYQKMRQEVALTSKALSESFGTALEHTAAKLDKLGGKLSRTVTLPLAAMGTAALKSAIDYEDAFAGVEKTVNATEVEFERLSESILSLSERKNLPFLPTEIASVAEAAGQLGVGIQDIEKFTETMLMMGQATTLGSEEAATAIAQFANITGMSLDDVDRLGSSIVELGNNSATTEADIMHMATRLSSAGSQIGMSDADILGLSAALASLGLEAQAGGSAFSKVMRQMAVDVETGKGNVKNFAEVAGLSVDEFSELFQEDATGALISFIAGLGDTERMGKSTIAMLDEMGITELRMSDALMRTSNANGLLTDSIRMSNRAWKEGNALQAEADKRNATTASRMKALKSQVVSAGISLGKSLLPFLNQVVDGFGKLVGWFGRLDESARSNLLLSGGIAMAAGPALKFVGKLTDGFGKLSKAVGGTNGFDTIGKALLSPMGAVAGVVALTAGIVALNDAMDEEKQKNREISQRMADITFSVDGEESVKITDAINQGIEDAEKAFDIEVGVKAEIDDLSTQIDTALLPITTGIKDKLSGKEIKALQSTVTNYVGGVLDGAVLATQAKAGRINETIGGIGSLTPEQKAAMVTNIENEGNAVIDELQAYEQEVNNLLALMASGEENITEANLARLQELLALIGDINIEIQMAQQSLEGYSGALTSRVKAGKGTNEEAGQAIAFSMEMTRNRLTQAEQQAEKDIALLQEAYQAAVDQNDILAAYTIQQEIDLKFLEKDSTLQELEEKGRQEINDLWNGMAKQYPEAAKDFERVIQGYNVASMIQGVDTIDDPTKRQEAMRKVGEEMSKLLPGADKLLSGENISEAQWKSAVDNYMTQINDMLPRLVEDNAESPMIGLFSQLLDKGTLEDMDLSELPESMKGILAALDFKTVFSDEGWTMGEEIQNGLRLGLEENQETSETAIKTAMDGILSSAKAALGIHSPSTEGADMGMNLMLGIQKGAYQYLFFAKLPFFAFSLSLKTLGENAIENLMTGIENKRQDLIDKMTSVATDAANAAAAILGTVFPSLPTGGGGNGGYGPNPAGNTTNNTTSNNYSMTVNAGNRQTAAQTARAMRNMLVTAGLNQ